MISTSQREHLTYTLIWQVLTLFAIGIIFWQYILPWFVESSAMLNKAEEAIGNYQEAQNKWYSYERITAILIEMGNKEELIKIIQATPNETRVALQKEWQWEYLSWLRNAINASDEDKKKLIQAKKKINSILPTLSPISANIDEENISLKQYIKFIEWNIINKFNLWSNISLGIQWLSFWNAANKIPSNIGTFDLRLDFKTTNEKIQWFINFIKESWNTDILTKSGILSEDQIPNIMSNPLITMESFSLQDSLDVKNNPQKENFGRATIRFYIRGWSKDDVTYLRESLKTRKDDLGKKIENAVKECKNNDVLCSQLGRLTDFQKKFTEFIRGVWEQWNTNWMWIGDIYGLSQQVTSLRALETEFDSFNAKISQ
jgi:hypothetical protein